MKDNDEIAVAVALVFVMLFLAGSCIIIPCRFLFFQCSLAAGKDISQLISANIAAVIIKKPKHRGVMFLQEKWKNFHTCTEASQAVGLWCESGETFISLTPACAVRTVCNPSFPPCLQTVIHHELIMVLRVNQAWGGGGKGCVEGYRSLLSPCA